MCCSVDRVFFAPFILLFPRRQRFVFREASLHPAAAAAEPIVPIHCVLLIISIADTVVAEPIVHGYVRYVSLGGGQEINRHILSFSSVRWR